MNAKIIFFNQTQIPPKTKTKFKKELSGHNDSSHGGRYKYKIKGILDTIKHIKPTKGSIIIQEKDYPTILQLMNKHNIQHKTYTIQIKPEELNK